MALRELRLRKQEFDLNVQQFGAQQAQQAAALQLQQGNQRLAQFQALQGFQGMLQNMRNPLAMSPFAGQIAGMTGQPQDMAQTVIDQTPAAAATTQSSAIQAANQEGAVDAATLAKYKSDFNQDHLMSSLFKNADNYLQSIPEAQRASIGQAMMTRLNSGQSVRDAVLSERFAGLSPEEQTQTARIASGLGLSAQDDASLGLTAAAQEISRRQLADTEAMNKLEYDFRVQALKNKGGEGSGHMLQVLDQRRQAIDALDKIQSTGTKTEVGLETYISQINNYNAMLRGAAPELFGKGAPQEIVDIPQGGKLSSGRSGFTNFFNNMAKKAGQK